MGQIVPQVTYIFPYVAQNETQIANTFPTVAKFEMHMAQLYLMWHTFYSTCGTTCIRDTGCSQ
jgi:hypothetical protein